jgi:hypothetical protein
MMTTEDIRKGEEWALKNGTHALMHKVIKAQPCGCDVQGAGNLKSPVRIVFCKKHEAVTRLLKLLRQAKGAINDELFSAGEDEVKQHPVLTGHSLLVKRIEKALKDLGA